MADKKRLGEILVQNNIVNEDTVNEALRVQVGGNRRLGHILLRMGAVTEDQLTATLSEQLQVPLTDPKEAFSPEVKPLLPRYLCNKYGVIPLALKKNNIMLTAMADPSDHEAISDIEHYTEKVVEPCLSKLSDIEGAIKLHVPYTIKDFFNPQVNTRVTRVIATIALALVVTFGVVTYNYIQTARFGTVSHLASSTLYEHHDLMVGFDKSGKISLLGRSAFADGYYSVTFNDLLTTKAFIQSRSGDFSVKQSEWLKWVLKTESAHQSKTSDLAGK